ncbi:AAA family ATPase [Methylobacterium sp. Leaf102]|uniref:ATP-dependent nuclease n=1 Tax=Methylobacterium sp. Leaf102 TaxID=1736253 RepID=UPI0009EBD26A|nr:AAA family ATPase [Methylobacterium sp. Leaf102]
MKLTKAQIIGFQSFSDSGLIEFSGGMNLIVGQNNVGKSSILRAFMPDLADDRHRSPNTWEEFKLPMPIVHLTISFNNTEFRDCLLLNSRSFIPVKYNDDYPAYVPKLLEKAEHEINIVQRPGQHPTTDYPGHRDFVWNENQHKVAIRVMADGGNLNYSAEGTDNDSSAEIVIGLWRREMFYFSAERMNIGRSAPDNAPRLSPNASNLPSVLLTLQGDRGDLFQKLVRHMREVFSTVGNVSVTPVSGVGLVEVRVWPTERMERVQLSFPLLQSGTGVAQVMSIFVAVMTVENAVIIIDEINSFLHPAAVKTLLRILQTEYSNHQYIVSTHAPEVIASSNPRNILLVQREGYESRITKLDIASVDALREVASQLGVSMADVFAADRVIWVEGPTEELCFPFIYAQGVGRAVPKGIIFTSVLTTGDFNAKRRDKALVYEIYQRLTTVAIPLLSAAIFSFDTEKLTNTEKEKMIQDSRGALHFLPRRLIECYMVYPDAICKFISDRDLTNQTIILPNVVEAKIKEVAERDKYKGCSWTNDLFDQGWLAKVDAANLIADVCGEISEQRVTFNKKDDTLSLLQIIQVEAPERLSELKDYVEGLVNAVSERQAAG